MMVKQEESFWREGNEGVYENKLVTEVFTPVTRMAVSTELHETHPGISRMKSLARQYVRWPGMDA